MCNLSEGVYEEVREEGCKEERKAGTERSARVLVETCKDLGCDSSQTAARVVEKLK